VTAHPSPAEKEFLDAVGLWRLTPGSFARDVIDTATECLVDGSDTATLRELAGASPWESRLVLEPLVLQTVEELGLSEELDPDVELSALLVLARRLASGRTAPRDLASWAHRNIGHDGDSRCQPFVELDDMYDEAEAVGSDVTEVDDLVRREADALLSGAPSPGLSESWPLLPPAMPRRSVVRRPRWSTRGGGEAPEG
jgi:hypothetical protein